MITIREIINLVENYDLKNALFLSDDTGNAPIEARDGILYFKQPCTEDQLVSTLTLEELNRIDKENGYYTIEVYLFYKNEDLKNIGPSPFQEIIDIIPE